MRLTAFALLALVHFPSQPAVAGEAAVPEPMRREVVRILSDLEERWIQVYSNRDLSLLQRIIADDFVATLADGAMRGKQEHIAAYPGDFATYATVANSDVQVHVYSREAAVVTGLYTAKLRAPPGAEPSQQYRWTDTWLLRKGSWQCVATHETRVK